MVVPAFGFSVGDFTAAIRLIGKASKALQECTGAEKQYQQAAVELSLLEDVLRRVQGLETSVENAATVQKIQICAHACHNPLAEFVTELGKFDLQLGFKQKRPVSVAGHVIRGGRKLQWAVKLEAQLAKLKAKIGPLLQLISILLQVSTSDDASRMQHTTLETADLSHKTFSQLQGLETYITQNLATRSEIASLLPAIDKLTLQQKITQDESLRTIQDSADAVNDRLKIMEDLLRVFFDQTVVATHPLASLPETVVKSGAWIHASAPDSNESNNELPQSHGMITAGTRGMTVPLLVVFSIVSALQRLWKALTTISTSPSLLLEDNIRLEDALGRVLTLPYEHFRFWEVLEARLRCEFRDRPGESMVARHQYHIVNLMGCGDRVLTPKTWDRFIVPGAKLAMSMFYQHWKVASHVCPRCNKNKDGSETQRWIQWYVVTVVWRPAQY